MRVRTKSPAHSEREEAILLALKRHDGPIGSDDLFNIVADFFADKRQFSGTMGGMTKTGRVASVRGIDGNSRIYSECDPSLKKVEPPREPMVRLPRVDELFTARAAAFHASMQARKVKPSMRNNPDKEDRKA